MCPSLYPLVYPLVYLLLYPLLCLCHHPKGGSLILLVHLYFLWNKMRSGHGHARVSHAFPPNSEDYMVQHVPFP